MTAPQLIKTNSDKTAAVNRAVPWIRIDETTPRGVKLLLINERYGVACIGQLTKTAIERKQFSHYQGLPYFAERTLEGTTAL